MPPLYLAGYDGSRASRAAVAFAARLAEADGAEVLAVDVYESAAHCRRARRGAAWRRPRRVRHPPRGGPAARGDLRAGGPSSRPPGAVRCGGVERPRGERERIGRRRREDPPGQRVAPHARQRRRPTAPRSALSARRRPRGRRDHPTNRRGRIRRGPGGARRADVRSGPGTKAGCAARGRRGRRARRVRQPGDHARRLATPPAGAIDVARCGSCSTQGHRTGRHVPSADRETRPRELLEFAEDATDVLVVGSRGFGPLHATIAGSVSSRVADEAPCPVIVVPRAADAGAEPTRDVGGAVGAAS